MAYSDAALLDSWRRKRDADAFRTLTHRYAGMVYACCRRILDNPTEAEDVAQECFELLATTTKPVEEYLAPWLHRVACNRALTRLRAEHRRAERESRFAAAQGEATEYAWDDIYGYVDEAIGTLPDDLRGPIVAHFLQGQSHAAIAEALVAPRSTITYRIEKGVDLLRQNLQEKGIAISGVSLAALLAANGAEAAPASLLSSLGKLALSGAGRAAGTGWKLPFLIKGKSLVTLAASLAIPLVGAGVLMKAGTIPSLGSATARPLTQEMVEKQAMRELRRGSAGMPHPGVKGQPAVSYAAVPLEPTGGVSGRVFNPATGRGLAFAVVGVDGPSGEMEVFTTPFGDYSFKNLAPGRYEMYCSAAFGYINAGYHNEQQVDVPPGAVIEDVDFERSKGVNVSGHVRDEQGRPVAGLSVNAENNAAPWTSDAESWTDGSFTLKRLYANQADVRFCAEGNGWISDWSKRYDIGTADIENVDIVVRKGARISGTLVDGLGKPVPATQLYAWPNDTGGGRTLPASTTDAQGKFDFKQVPEGNLSITVNPEGSMNRMNNVLDTLDVGAGETLDGLVVVLDETQGMRIAGTITDAAGKPLEGKYVECYGPVTDGRNTDAEGRFEFTRLPDGYYSLMVDQELRVRDNFLPDGKDVNIVLGNTTTVQCRVVDKSTGEPVRRFRAQAMADFSPSLWFALDRLPHIYDSQGHFWVEVEHGNYNMVVRAHGYAAAITPVNAAAGAVPPAEVEIALEPVAPITVEVRDPQGALLPGAKVWVMLDRGPENTIDFKLGKTGDDGVLRCDWQPPGDGYVYASHPLYAMGFTEWPKAGLVHIQLGEGGTVTGTLQAGDTAPDYVSIGIVLPGQKGLRQFFTQVEEDGTFELNKAPAGELELRAMVQWRKGSDWWMTRQMSEQIEVADGATTEVGLHLQRGDCTISGTVLLEGMPFGMAEVSAKLAGSDGQQSTYSSRVGRDGRFQLEGLPEGKAEVTLFNGYYQAPSAKNPMEPFEANLVSGQMEEVNFEYSLEDF